MIENTHSMFIILTVAGIVGEVDDSGDGHYIWTHKKFDIGYNGEHIVDVNLTSENKIKLKPGVKIPFSYEVIYISIYYNDTLIAFYKTRVDLFE